jgi:hypothetical protein
VEDSRTLARTQRDFGNIWGLLEAITLLSSLIDALEPRCIVIKSLWSMHAKDSLYFDGYGCVHWANHKSMSTLESYKKQFVRRPQMYVLTKSIHMDSHIPYLFLYHQKQRQCCRHWTNYEHRPSHSAVFGPLFLNWVSLLLQISIISATMAIKQMMILPGLERLPLCHSQRCNASL